MLSWRRFGIYSVIVSTLTACSFAPKYHPPIMPIPANYKETNHWVAAKPSLPKSTQTNPWWTLYHDPVLNRLEQRLTCGNENLKLALSRYQEACAIAQSTRSQLYPTILGLGSATNQQNVASVDGFVPNFIYQTYIVSATLNYELDAWGSVRNAVVASDSQARASRFNLAAVDLSMHAALAADYYALRGYDAQQKVLNKTVVSYKKALILTQQLFKGGAASSIDVDQAMTQLENAKTLAIEIRLNRAKLENAIAVLLGEIPSNFHIKPRSTPFHLVTVNPDLPSTLLERRPDVAAAEQRVKAANATIGVARAAFFPAFNLTAMAGYRSRRLSDLLSTPSLIWALGPSTGLALMQPEVTQVLFDGYNLVALLKQATASYYEAVSIYRQTVLTAFQNVEDALVSIRRLDEASKTQKQSSIAALHALQQANFRYEGRIATFLDVVVTENQALRAELALIDIHTRRQLASVELVKALGGGWG